MKISIDSFKIWWLKTQYRMLKVQYQVLKAEYRMLKNKSICEAFSSVSQRKTSKTAYQVANLNRVDRFIEISRLKMKIQALKFKYRVLKMKVRMLKNVSR